MSSHASNHSQRYLPLITTATTSTRRQTIPKALQDDNLQQVALVLDLRELPECALHENKEMSAFYVTPKNKNQRALSKLPLRNSPQLE
jgi:hypothetical protein